MAESLTEIVGSLSLSHIAQRELNSTRKCALATALGNVRDLAYDMLESSVPGMYDFFPSINQVPYDELIVCYFVL